MIRRIERTTARIPHIALLGLVLSVPAAAQAGMTLTYSDVRYGTYVDASNTWGESRMDLDAYLHLGAALPSPVLVEIHGGGWSKGAKSDFDDYLNNASGDGIIEKAYADGMAVISINYPLSEIPELQGGGSNPNFPGNLFPVPEEATRQAIQFIRKQASVWNLDPGRVFLVGGSAGGHLSLWAAMKKDLRDPLETDPAELAYYSSRADGVVSCWTPTFLGKHHMKVTPGRPAVWNHWGYTTELDFFNNVSDDATYAASPGWLATHGGANPAEDDALAELNAAVPVLAVYPVGHPGSAPTCSVGSGYTVPYPDPHGHLFGLWMSEAFRTTFLSASPWFTVACTPPATVDWSDFTFELLPSSPNASQKDAASTNVADWLQVRAAALTARLTPDPLPGYSPLHIGWSVNLAGQSSSAFLADQISDPTNNHIDAAIWYGSTFIPLPYETLVTMEQSGDAHIVVAANAIHITLDAEISQYFATLGPISSGAQVKRSGSTTVQKSGVYSP
jgi:hypothetical protein